MPTSGASAILSPPARPRPKGSKKPVNWPLVVIETHRILVAQENKKKADAQIKVAINAFNEYGSGCPDQ